MYPYTAQGPNWHRHTAFRNTTTNKGDDVVRVVTMYDNMDGTSGADVIYGGGADDVIHGQRGDDQMYVLMP